MRSNSEGCGFLAVFGPLMAAGQEPDSVCVLCWMGESVMWINELSLLQH